MNSLIERLRDWANEAYVIQDGELPAVRRDMTAAANEIERKSDAIQRLWRERDELRAAMVAERARLRQLVEAVRNANSDAEDGDTFRLLKPGQERAWMALLAGLEAPSVKLSGHQRPAQE